MPSTPSKEDEATIAAVKAAKNEAQRKRRSDPKVAKKEAARYKKWYAANRKKKLAAVKAREQEKRPEITKKRALKQHQWYQDNIEERRAVRAEYNHNVRGHKPRATPKPGQEVVVRASRRYRIELDPVTGMERIYFTSKLGFTPADLRAILKEYKEKVEEKLK